MFILRKLVNYIHYVHPYDFHYMLNGNVIGISRDMFGNIAWSKYGLQIIYDNNNKKMYYYY
jgi:hypothetical protein